MKLSNAIKSIHLIKHKFISMWPRIDLLIYSTNPVGNHWRCALHTSTFCYGISDKLRNESVFFGIGYIFAAFPYSLVFQSYQFLSSKTYVFTNPRELLKRYEGSNFAGCLEFGKHVNCTWINMYPREESRVFLTSRNKHTRGPSQ